MPQFQIWATNHKILYPLLNILDIQYNHTLVVYTEDGDNWHSVQEDFLHGCHKRRLLASDKGTHGVALEVTRSLTDYEIGKLIGFLSGSLGKRYAWGMLPGLAIRALLRRWQRIQHGKYDYRLAAAKIQTHQNPKMQVWKLATQYEIDPIVAASLLINASKAEPSRHVCTSLVDAMMDSIEIELFPGLKYILPDDYYELAMVPGSLLRVVDDW